MGFTSTSCLYPRNVIKQDKLNETIPALMLGGIVLAALLQQGLLVNFS